MDKETTMNYVKTLLDHLYRTHKIQIVSVDYNDKESLIKFKKI